LIFIKNAIAIYTFLLVQLNFSTYLGDISDFMKHLYIPTS
jgi:hypothetical protein